MNLQEAVNTGKPFKRPCWRSGPNGQEPWVKSGHFSNKIIFDSFPHNSWNPRPEDVLADDYVIKSPEDSFEKIGEELAEAKTLDKINVLIGRAQKLRQAELPF